MDIDGRWEGIQDFFLKSLKSSYHYAVATVNEDGTPHVTPIGSLILEREHKGFFFEQYPVHLTKNLQNNQAVCILAVRSNVFFLLKSLMLKRFSSPPAIRLIGTVGERREATDREIRLIHKRIQSLLPFGGSLLRKLGGYKTLWGNLHVVRDIHFHSFEPVHFGIMTRGLWSKDKKEKGG